MIDLIMIFFYTLLAVAVVVAILYFTKPWWQGQRTRVVGALLSLCGYVSTADLTWLPDKIEGPIMFGSGLVVIALRQMTTTPPGEKENF